MNLRNEIAFWTGIMRDHAIFQTDALAPTENSYSQSAMQFTSFFQQMLQRICSGEALEMLCPVLLQGLDCFIEYKRMVLKGLMTCGLKMNLPPSLINHQINEALEFKSLLTMPMQCSTHTALEWVNRMKIWLADSVGHAAGIGAFLDPSEGLLAEEAMKCKERFDKLLTKASELEMMLSKTCLRDGALDYLAEETVNEMEKFICFLEKIKKLRMCCKVLGFGTLAPLLPDHFIREHRYFIEKIKEGWKSSAA